MSLLPHCKTNDLDIHGNVRRGSAFFLIAAEVQRLAAASLNGPAEGHWKALVRELGGEPELRGHREATISATIAAVNRIIDAYNRGKHRPNSYEELRNRIDTPPTGNRFQRLLARLRQQHRHD